MSAYRTVEELDPELFIWELYNSAGLWELDDALCAAESFGFCDSSRLAVRPRTGQFALMIEWPNGVKFWCHVTEEMLCIIKKRLQRIEASKRDVSAIDGGRHV